MGGETGGAPRPAQSAARAAGPDAPRGWPASHQRPRGGAARRGGRHPPGRRRWATAHPGPREPAGPASAGRRQPSWAASVPKGRAPRPGGRAAPPPANQGRGNLTLSNDHHPRGAQGGGSARPRRRAVPTQAGAVPARTGLLFLGRSHRRSAPHTAIRRHETPSASRHSARVRSGRAAPRARSGSRGPARTAGWNRSGRRDPLSPVARRRGVRRSTHARLTRDCSAPTRAARPASPAAKTRSRTAIAYARPSAAASYPSPDQLPPPMATA